VPNAEFVGLHSFSLVSSFSMPFSSPSFLLLFSLFYYLILNTQVLNYMFGLVHSNRLHPAPSDLARRRHQNGAD